MFNICNGAFDGKYMTSYLMVIIMSALSLTIYEIFTNQIECQKFYLDNEGQEEKWDMCHSTGNVRFDIDELFRILLSGNIHLRKRQQTHT